MIHETNNIIDNAIDTLDNITQIVCFGGIAFLSLIVIGELVLPLLLDFARRARLFIKYAKIYLTILFLVILPNSYYYMFELLELENYMFDISLQSTIILPFIFSITTIAMIIVITTLILIFIEYVIKIVKIIVSIMKTIVVKYVGH